MWFTIKILFIAGLIASSETMFIQLSFFRKVKSLINSKNHYEKSTFETTNQLNNLNYKSHFDETSFICKKSTNRILSFDNIFLLIVSFTGGSKLTVYWFHFYKWNVILLRESFILVYQFFFVVLKQRSFLRDVSTGTCFWVHSFKKHSLWYVWR